MKSDREKLGVSMEMDSDHGISNLAVEVGESNFSEKDFNKFITNDETVQVKSPRELSFICQPDAENLEDEKESKEKITCLKNWFTGTNFLVYCSHFLSAWGDRMWSFGIGLFLIVISPDSLQLTAIYGLSRGISVLFFGAIVGDWVDNTPRLKVAQLSLVLQNVFVVMCAGAVYAFIWFKDDVSGLLDDWVKWICYAGIIFLGILSNIFSIARVIAIERDWIVEICGRDKDHLAQMTASLRRIDLTTKILAPIATGQIMTYAGLENGALFIGGWNIVSVFVEYFLVWKVYNTVPALKKKKDLRKSEKIVDDADAVDFPVAMETEGANEQAECCHGNKENEAKTEHDNSSNNDEKNLRNSHDSIERKLSNCANKELFELEDEESEISQELDNKTLAVGEGWELNDKIHTRGEGEKRDDKMPTRGEREEMNDKIHKLGEGKDLEDKSHTIVEGKELNDKICTRGEGEKLDTDKAERTCCGKCLRRSFNSFIILYKGWRTYMRYDVARAGLGLAFLYMTVLGFDNITVGFSYSQGISESILGVLMAASALVGIAGTVVYPYLRRKVGLERTGLFSLSAQIACLSLCVVSIWMPGSPFDPLGTAQNTTDLNCTSRNFVNGSETLSVTDRAGVTYAEGNNNASVISAIIALNTTSNDVPCRTQPVSYLSIVLLMAGIIAARFGLWVADLAITQLFLENVIESERGVVNGVQSSLNQLMDMLKFAMVVAIPQPHLFGFLVLVSFVFVVCGGLLYACYSRKARGHLFHFDKCINNNTSYSVEA